MTCKIPVNGVRASTLPERAHLKVSASAIFSSIIHQAEREMVVAFRGKADEGKLMTGILESKNSQVNTSGKSQSMAWQHLAQAVAGPPSNHVDSFYSPQESQKDLLKM